ncbi:hypothetical protein RUM44_010990 [Polyplax serrata]|uniref:ribonuclease Z n=1 Tax=Polyplax serrata TaxID=468196 RepID=A0ABR1ANR6_POLSC
MPLEKNHRAQARLAYELRKERLEKAEDHNKFLTLEVIGNGAEGCPRSVYMCTDHRKYLFNCGEGTQRLANEFRIKLSRTPHVFITYPSWENVSGLLGMALTLQGIGIPEINIHGPKIIENVFNATNKFVALRTIKVNVIECDSHIDFNDGCIKVKHVPLHSVNSPNLNKKLSESTISPLQESSNKPWEVVLQSDDNEYDNDDDIDYYAHLNKKRKHSPSPPPKKKVRSQSLAPTAKCKSSKHAVSFICHTKKSLGKLDIKKCVDLGIPYGPILGQLKKGETITLPNGNVINSSDVKEPDESGAIVIVVECPSEDYLDSLLQESAFYRHQSGNTDEIASVVIHFTNSNVLEHTKYKEWISRFPKETKHLIINNTNKGFTSIGIHRMQQKLHMLHPEIFPLLPQDNVPQYPRTNSDIPSEHQEVTPTVVGTDNSSLKIGKVLPRMVNKIDEIYQDYIYLKCGNDPYIRAQMLCHVFIRPKDEFDYCNSLVLKVNEINREVELEPHLLEAMAKLKSEIKTMKLTNEEYPKLLFLGTGSSQPSKLRNTSGIILFLDDKTAMILDCGEGTYNQMFHFYGREKAHEILLNLNAIYISHMHADHHMGLITLLKQRAVAHKEKCALEKKDENSEPPPILLIAPIQITKWLYLFDDEFDKISHLYSMVPSSNLVEGAPIKAKYKDCLKELNAKEIKTTLVDHCPNAFGVAITHKDGWKLTYSGDTRPCPALVKIGKNSDILIHEATMDDSLHKSAKLKLHSTSSQAINIGKEMNARFIILTHFSQRYSHVPIFNDNFTKEIGVAFDNMMVSLKHFPILAKLIPVLKIMFHENYEEILGRIETSKVKSLRRGSSSE